MSLMDNARADVGLEPTGVEVVETKKKSNSEYQKRARERALVAAETVKNFLNEKGLLDKAPQDVKDAIDVLTKAKKAGGSSVFGKPVIYSIFGDAPKKGAKVTTLEVFQKCGKGYAEMRAHMKKWEKAGIIVRLDEKTASYVLDSDVAAYTA